MPKLPRPSGKEMVKFPERQGYAVVRVRGSHQFLEGNDRRTSVPVHSNETLKIGTLRGILPNIDMSPADFARLSSAERRREIWCRFVIAAPNLN